MKQIGLFLVLFIPTFFLSCGTSAPESTAPVIDVTEPVVENPDPVRLTWEALAADSVPAGTTVVIEGYVGDLGSFVSSVNGQYSIPVYGRRHQGAGLSLSIYTTIGSGRNMVNALPDNFTPADFKIVTDDSTIVTQGDKVRVTATLNSSSLDYYTADLLKIEAIEDDFDPAILAQAIPLTNDLIRNAGDTMIYCYITGKLALPTLIYSLTNDIMLDLRNSSVAGISSVSMPVSDDAPSSMSDIPDNYSSSDLVLRDHRGAIIPPGSTVRIYGTWERSTLGSENSTDVFYVEELAAN